MLPGSKPKRLMRQKEDNFLHSVDLAVILAYHGFTNQQCLKANNSNDSLKAIETIMR